MLSVQSAITFQTLKHLSTLTPPTTYNTAIAQKVCDILFIVVKINNVSYVCSEILILHK